MAANPRSLLLAQVEGDLCQARADLLQARGALAAVRAENDRLRAHAERLARLVYDHRLAWHDLSHAGAFDLCDDDGCRMIVERYGPWGRGDGAAGK